MWPKKFSCTYVIHVKFARNSFTDFPRMLKINPSMAVAVVAAEMDQRQKKSPSYKGRLNNSLGPYCNNKPTRRIVRRTNRIMQKYWSLDRYSNFLLMSKSYRATENRKDDSLKLATIRDDTWYVHNMQHIIPNNKRWDYLEFTLRIEEPMHSHGWRWPPSYSLRNRHPSPTNHTWTKYV